MAVISSSSGVCASTTEEKILLAKNPATSPMILEALCLEHSPILARHVAQNPSTPATALLYLSKKEYTLRMDAFANPSLGADNLVTMLPQKEPSERAAIALNPALPILNRLMLAVNDKSVLVRKAAWSWIEGNAQAGWREAISSGIGLSFELETINGRQTVLNYLQSDKKDCDENDTLIETLLSIELGEKLSAFTSAEKSAPTTSKRFI